MGPGTWDLNVPSIGSTGVPIYLVIACLSVEPIPKTVEGTLSPVTRNLRRPHLSVPAKWPMVFIASARASWPVMAEIPKFRSEGLEFQDALSGRHGFLFTCLLLRDSV